MAQLGDTWAAYFRSLSVMPYEQRHTWDVRVLWYWNDMVNAEEIADVDGLWRRVRGYVRGPPRELIAPLFGSDTMEPLGV